MKKLAISTLLLTLSLGGCASTTSTAGPTAATRPEQCELPNLAADVDALYQDGSVANVEPIHRREFRARALQFDRVVGARFDVPAPRNISAGYAERVLSCHAASGAAGSDDPLGVAGIRDVDVSIRGPRMRIAVVGRDQSAGRAILQSARAMERGSVTVQQVAMASGSCDPASVEADMVTLHQGGATNVQPVRQRQVLARALQFERTIGASYDVQGPRHMSTGYAERVLSCHAGLAAAGSNHPVASPGVRNVDVRMVGARMRIEVTAQGAEEGLAILERARAMESGRVSVQQVAAAGTSASDSADAAIIHQAGVTNVAPIRRRESAARALQFDRVIGARYDVPAPAGMSVAHVERVLSSFAESGAAGAQHPLGAEGIRDVAVRIVGSRMRVSVVADDHTAGNDILSRARSLENGRVTVQQVAAVGTGQPTL